MDPRSLRARTERMAVSAIGGGVYEVDSESDSHYLVDLVTGRCTCPDHMMRRTRCKHLRRVAIEINEGRVPSPGKRTAHCAVCDRTIFVPENDDPPFLCPNCRVEPGDAVVDRETGDLLVVVNVTDKLASEVEVGDSGRTVADYPGNEEYDADVPVVEVLYPIPANVSKSDVKPHHVRSYSFPLSRLDRKVGVDDSQSTLTEFSEETKQTAEKSN